MGALEKVSAMIRSLPGTWEIMKLYFIVQRQITGLKLAVLQGVSC